MDTIDSFSLELGYRRECVPAVRFKHEEKHISITMKNIFYKLKRYVLERKKEDAKSHRNESPINPIFWVHKHQEIQPFVKHCCILVFGLVKILYALSNCPLLSTVVMSIF
jgi:hypothetical protein